MSQFTNPYHFVPVQEPPKEGSEHRKHWLNVNTEFDNRELKHYSHAQYHPKTHSGRLLCRLTTENAMFVGALREQKNDREPSTVTPFELEGQPAIPASTLRGLLSSIVETASNSALRVLQDQVLSYRNKAKKESLSASVYRFFSEIDPELLPFHKGRNFISPAELLFGFTQKDEDEKGLKKAERNTDAGRALAGRLQISFGQLAPGQAVPDYHERVLLKSLLSPKLPCPMMYFKNRYTSQEYIHKPDLKPVKHHPQGRKMYVHNHRDNGNKPWKSLDPQQNRNLKSQVTPVRENTEFYFHIDFNNLSDWELGMLCYALRPTDEFRHKLGMGKSIGLGRVRIDPIGLLFIDRQQRYRATDIFQAPRYHAAWIDNTIKWPTDCYHRERTEPTEHLAPNHHWQELRQAFRKTIPANVRNALELLGNPNKVAAVVQTPQIAGLTGAQLEKENFKWFGNNEKTHHQMLTPLDENSTELPTFERH